MSTVSAAEAALIRADFEDTMNDTCQIGRRSKIVGTKDPNDGEFVYGASGTMNDTVSCGVDLGKSDEAQDGSAATVRDGTIRLPIGTTDVEDKDISGRNRIKVTHRYGTELDTAEVYAVEGKPRRGLTALVCNVSLVVGESRK